eukprot:158753_1
MSTLSRCLKFLNSTKSLFPTQLRNSGRFPIAYVSTSSLHCESTGTNRCEYSNNNNDSNCSKTNNTTCFHLKKKHPMKKLYHERPGHGGIVSNHSRSAGEEASGRWDILQPGTLKQLKDHTVETIKVGGHFPQFFLSGDGHRHPPFKWVTSCPRLKLHFQELMGKDQLCAHVEMHQDQVTERAIPGILIPLIHQHKIFGWELDIYRDLGSAMEHAMEILGQFAANFQEREFSIKKMNKQALEVAIYNFKDLVYSIVVLDKDILRVDGFLSHKISNPEKLRKMSKDSWEFRDYFGKLKFTDLGIEGRNKNIENAYVKFLKYFYRTAMELRTDVGVQKLIGANIQKSIDKHANNTHIITVGNAHIEINPVQHYINIGNAFGVIDAFQG